MKIKDFDVIIQVSSKLVLDFLVFFKKISCFEIHVRKCIAYNEFLNTQEASFNIRNIEKDSLPYSIHIQVHCVCICKFCFVLTMLRDLNFCILSYNGSVIKCQQNEEIRKLIALNIVE